MHRTPLCLFVLEIIFQYQVKTWREGSVQLHIPTCLRVPGAYAVNPCGAWFILQPQQTTQRLKNGMIVSVLVQIGLCRNLMKLPNFTMGPLDQAGFRSHCSAGVHKTSAVPWTSWRSESVLLLAAFIVGHPTLHHTGGEKHDCLQRSSGKAAAVANIMCYGCHNNQLSDERKGNL